MPSSRASALPLRPRTSSPSAISCRSAAWMKSVVVAAPGADRLRRARRRSSSPRPRARAAWRRPSTTSDEPFAILDVRVGDLARGQLGAPGDRLGQRARPSRPRARRGNSSRQLPGTGAVDHGADRVPLDRRQLLDLAAEQELQLRALHARRVAEQLDRARRVVGIAGRQVLRSAASRSGSDGCESYGSVSSSRSRSRCVVRGLGDVLVRDEAAEARPRSAGGARDRSTGRPRRPSRSRTPGRSAWTRSRPAA